MEKELTEAWLKNVNLAFDEYLEASNIEGCRHVIGLLEEEGFKTEANGMLDELLDQPVIKFMAAANYSTL